MPCPSPISCQFARCAGVASDSRHDHASGTLITRPSTKWAVIVSSVTSTRPIRDSTLTAVLMPCLDNCWFVFHNQTPNDIQLAWAEPFVPRDGNGCQPEFGVLTIAPNVNVHRLVAVEAVEEEPVRSWYP